MYKKSDVEEPKTWFETVNNIGEDTAVKTRNEYDAFLEKCLSPYGIDKSNVYKHADRVYIEEENTHVEGFECDMYQRFYIDGIYAFTIVSKQRLVNEGRMISGMITTYEKVVEQDRLPKEEPMTNKEAIGYIKRIISGNSKPDMALKMAIKALEEIEHYQVPHNNYSGLFDKED